MTTDITKDDPTAPEQDLFADVSRLDVVASNARALMTLFVKNRDYRVSAADRYLNDIKAGDELAADERALTRLSNALDEAMPKVQDWVWNSKELAPKSLADIPEDAPPWRRLVKANTAPTIERDGMLLADELFAKFLDTIGEVGRSDAQRIRESSRDRWARREEIAASELWGLWTDQDPWSYQDFRYPRWVKILLQDLWTDKVRPELQALGNAVALTRAVFTPVVMLGTKKWKLACEPSGQQRLMFPGDAPAIIIPQVSVDTVKAIRSIENGLDGLRTMPGQRVLDWLVCAGHQRYYRDGDRIVYLKGNWNSIAKQMGLHESDGGKVRDILEALHYIRFKLPNTDTGTELIHITREKTPGPARRGRPSLSLQITILPPLLPDYGRNYAGTSLDIREARQLVPWIPIPERFAGSHAERAPQVVMSRLVVLELRMRAIELVENGGVSISDNEWHRLRDTCSISTKLWPDVKAVWLSNPRPFLEEPKPGLFHLASSTPEQDQAHKLLLQSGELMRAGAERGRKGAAHKRSRILRKAQ